MLIVPPMMLMAFMVGLIINMINIREWYNGYINSNRRNRWKW
jgi:hypothetical protein